MLGAGRASQYAGWWVASDPVVQMSSTATIQYALGQTPSFSWLNVPDSSTTPLQGYPGTQAFPAPGSMDVANIPSQFSYDNNSFVQFCTFAISYPSGLSYNDGWKYDQKFQGDSGDFTSNMAWVISTNNSLQINWPGVSTAELPGTDYTEYNDRWMTVVASADPYAPDNFADWTGPGYSSGATYFSRMAIYDTETGELLVKKDDAQYGRAMGFPTDFATWISDAGGNISTQRGDSYSWSLGQGSSGYPDEYMRITNFWCCFGLTFDPLSVTDTSWRTTRPSENIGNAKAWFNGQFAGYGNTASYVTAWSSVSDMDRFTPTATDVQIDLIQYSGNSTIFNDRYSSTNVPLSKG